MTGLGEKDCYYLCLILLSFLLVLGRRRKERKKGKDAGEGFACLRKVVEIFALLSFSIFIYLQGKK